VVDGLANGMGYAAILAVIGVIREVLGYGTILDFTVLSTSWYVPNQVMILAPGAFVVLGLLIAMFNAINARKGATDAKPAGGH
jgi:electron transport complex protein RnfE